MRDDINHKMVHDLGLAPALEIDDDQRFEQLREWHEEDAEKDAAENLSAHKKNGAKLPPESGS